MSQDVGTLFGRFTGQSILKQGDRRFRLTPDSKGGASRSDINLLQVAVELEGSFGIVGKIDGNTMFEAHVEEVIPPIPSSVLDKLIKEGEIDPDWRLRGWSGRKQPFSQEMNGAREEHRRLRRSGNVRRGLYREYVVGRGLLVLEDQARAAKRGLRGT